MSTRCHVKIIDERGDSLMMYNHSNGSPMHMIPCLQRAYKMSQRARWTYTQGWPGRGELRLGKKDQTVDGYIQWKGSKLGVAASFLCAADPGGFEPRSNSYLQGDIEWLYTLYLSLLGGALVQWDIDLRIPGKGFCDAPVENRLVLVAKRQGLMGIRTKKQRQDLECGPDLERCKHVRSHHDKMVCPCCDGDGYASSGGYDKSFLAAYKAAHNDTDKHLYIPQTSLYVPNLETGHWGNKKSWVHRISQEQYNNWTARRTSNPFTCPDCFGTGKCGRAKREGRM